MNAICVDFLTFTLNFHLCGGSPLFSGLWWSWTQWSKSSPLPTTPISCMCLRPATTPKVSPLCLNSNQSALHTYLTSRTAQNLWRVQQTCTARWSIFWTHSLFKPTVSLFLLRSVCAVSQQQQLSVGVPWDSLRPCADSGPGQHREAPSWHPRPWGGAVLHRSKSAGHKNSYCIRESKPS